MIKKSDFVKKLYVVIEESANDKYFVAAAKPTANDGDLVAIYELAEIKRMVITEELK